MDTFDLRKYLAEGKLLKEDLIDQIKQIQDYEKTEDSLDYNGYFVQKYIDGGETIYVVWEDRGENVDSDPQPDFESTNPNAIKDFLTKSNPVKEDYDDYYDDEDDYDSGMSYSSQVSSDRSDYANEMVAAGKWSEEQAAEYKMGA